VDPLQTFDAQGRVIYVGSFSKTMLPTLRLGFLVTPPSLRRGPAQSKLRHRLAFRMSSACCVPFVTIIIVRSRADPT